MKQSFVHLSAMVILVISMLCISCNNEEIKVPNQLPNEQVSTTAYNTLLQELNLYSKNFISQKSSRSSIPSTEYSPIIDLNSNEEVFIEEEPPIIPIQPLRIGKVAKADCKGAIRGAKAGFWAGILVGACSSLLAAATSYTTTMTSTPIATVDIKGEVNQIDSTGYYHNLIVAQTMPTITQNISTISEAEIFDLAVNALPQFNESHTTEQKEEIKKNFLHFQEIAIKPSEEEANKNIQKEYPELVEEMKVVDLYFESINQMTNSTEVINYTHDYKNIIIDSEIPRESKQRLEGGLSVATNSLLIWTPIE